MSIWPLSISYTADYFWNTLFGIKVDSSILTSLFLSLWKDIVLYSNAFPPFLENNHMFRSLLNNVSNHSQDSNTHIYSFIQQIWIESTQGPGWWNHVQRMCFPERRNRWDTREISVRHCDMTSPGSFMKEAGITQLLGVLLEDSPLLSAPFGSTSQKRTNTPKVTPPSEGCM